MNGKWHDLVDQDCSCGKEHRSDVEEIVIEPGALKRLRSGEEIRRIQSLCDLRSNHPESGW